MSNLLDSLTQRLMPEIQAVQEHSLYSQLHSTEAVCCFMEQHVFAVWDFMCLLKTLQSRLVSNSAPWFPPKDAKAARWMGRIVLEEEGDLSEDGKTYQCHYDLYLHAMQRLGANTRVIQQFLENLRSGVSLKNALAHAEIYSSTRAFVQTTFDFF